MRNSGRSPRGKPTATESRYLTYGACWVFECFHHQANSDNGLRGSLTRVCDLFACVHTRDLGLQSRPRESCGVQECATELDSGATRAPSVARNGQPSNARGDHARSPKRRGPTAASHPQRVRCNAWHASTRCRVPGDAQHSLVLPRPSSPSPSLPPMVHPIPTPQ